MRTVSGPLARHFFLNDLDLTRTLETRAWTRDSRRSDWTTTLPDHRYDGLLRAYDDARAAKAAANPKPAAKEPAGRVPVDEAFQR